MLVIVAPPERLFLIGVRVESFMSLHAILHAFMFRLFPKREP